MRAARPPFAKLNCNRRMVGARGFEPPTPCPPDKCANRAALRSDGSAYRAHGAAMQRGNCGIGTLDSQLPVVMWWQCDLGRRDATEPGEDNHQWQGQHGDSFQREPERSRQRRNHRDNEEQVGHTAAGAVFSRPIMLRTFRGIAPASSQVHDWTPTRTPSLRTHTAASALLASWLRRARLGLARRKSLGQCDAGQRESQWIWSLRNGPRSDTRLRVGIVVCLIADPASDRLEQLEHHRFRLRTAARRRRDNARARDRCHCAATIPVLRHTKASETGGSTMPPGPARTVRPRVPWRPLHEPRPATARFC